MITLLILMAVLEYFLISIYQFCVKKNTKYFYSAFFGTILLGFVLGLIYLCIKYLP